MINLNSKQATAGVTTLLVVAILFVVNYLVGGLGFGNFRVDLTEDKLYTLSDGTRNVIGQIDPADPVQIRFYVTNEDRVMPPVLKSYARTVEDMLIEFEKISDGKIVLEKLNPNPNTEEEDKAREDEIQGMQVNAEGDNIYLGMTVQQLQQKEVIPFLNPNEETALEYNVARAIAKVARGRKSVVGVMSSMPIQGSPMFPFQRQQGDEPWVIVQRLRMDYEVRSVEMTADKIDKDIDVLVVVHPSDIGEKTEFAIDQYLLGGGKVIAFVDPQAWIAQAYSGRQDPMRGGATNFVTPTSDLQKLFKAWGVGYKKEQVVADMSYRAAMGNRVNPTALSLPGSAINSSDRITAQLQSITMVGAGAFDVDQTEGITAVPLLESSENSEMIDSTDAEKLRSEPLANFNPTGRKKVLAVRLSGKFKTAFPDGPPASPAGNSADTGGAQEDSAAPKAGADGSDAPKAPDAPAAPPIAPPPPAPAESATSVTPPTTDAGKDKAGEGKADDKNAEKPKADFLKESSGNESVVLLFSDADMMYDSFCVQQDRMTGMLMAINSNIPLFLNAVELMSGGGDLLAVRSRASTQRPFTKIQEMQDAVESQFRPKLQALNDQLQQTAQKISTIKLKKDEKSQTLIIDPSQAKELDNLMKTQSEINKQIREVKKEQNKEINSKENFLTWVNVAGMPVLVVVVGILLALRRRAATAAR